MTNMDKLMDIDSSNYIRWTGIIYDLLDINPVGCYHRSEDIVDDIVCMSGNDGEKYCKDNNIPYKLEPYEEYEKYKKYARPFEIMYLEKYLDYDRKEMVKVLNDVKFDPDDLLDRVTKARENIDKFRENKEYIDKLSDTLYDKCVFNLMAYELVRGMKVIIYADWDRE